MNNIKNLRLSKGMKQSELAKFLNVAQGTLSYWERGEYDIDNKSLLKLSDYFKVSVDYLLGKSVHSALTPPEAIRIPVLGHIPAGVPIEAVEDILDYEEVPIDWGKGGKEYFALQIKGDSMFPNYLDGDVVIFHKTCDFQNGDCCAVIVNGYDATFKKVLRQQNGIVLQPLNVSQYEPTFYSNIEVESSPVCIVGIAIEIRRKVNRV